MSVQPGDQIGNYEVLAQIGKGGMGEVFRARDKSLGRDVAIKVLPAALAHDPDRLARFDREAKVLATLNHPNIAVIHALVDRAIVMELVEGPTLQDRLERGAIPLDETLAILRQIADALEAAHEKGIVHRDLKPANVKVREDGTVKVLDFGLATAVQTSPREPGSAAMSPTLTLGATEAGMILGTASYMAPEQAAGRVVDKRADIWSFGVVLWEMLTGKRLFEAEDVTHTLADVLRAPITFDALPAGTPRPIVDLLRRCLDRNVKTRLRDIGEARVAIAKYVANPDGGTEVPRQAEGLSHGASLIPWAVAAAVTVIAATLGFVHFREKPPAPEPMRFQIPEPEKAAFAGAPPIVSPDGRRVAFVAGSGGDARLWVRSLDTLEARPLAGTDGVSPNFSSWSPDSRLIAFAQGRQLRKVDASGGPPQTVCDLPGNGFRGGGWGPGGVIIFGTQGTGLWRVAEAGGTASPLTKLDASRLEAFHTAPSFLPDGRHFVYIRRGGPDVEGIYLGSLDLKPEQQSSKRLLATNGLAQYAPSANDPRMGHLLFLREGSLMAQPFDTTRLEFSGDAFPIAEGVGNNFQNSWFSASATGVLVYRSGASSSGDNRLTWFDRAGKNLGTAGDPSVYSVVSLSPDGTRAAVMRTDVGSGGGNTDIWLHEFARGTTTRFTFDPALDGWPVWSPDGSRIAFSSQRGGVFNLYQKVSTGAGNEDVLLKSSEQTFAQDWSRDGRFLIYSQAGGGITHLWILPLEGDKKPVAYLKSEFYESEGRFSPDTRFVAYNSNASGRTEIYVQPFPDASGGKWMVSKGGGAHPRWRRDGKELFYISGDSKMMALDVTLSPTFKAGVPKMLFPAPILGGGGSTNVTRYDVTADGQRFLINTAGAEVNPSGASPPITVWLNWQAGLKK